MAKDKQPFQRTPENLRGIRVSHNVLHLIDPNVAHNIEEKLSLLILTPILFAVGGIVILTPTLFFLYLLLHGF